MEGTNHISTNVSDKQNAHVHTAKETSERNYFTGVQEQ